jgi:CubicO group peptidase (beta-lactamase class C family)
MMLRFLLFCALASVHPSAAAMSDADLKALAETRFQGDRTGACVAVAVIEKTVARAYVCADPKQLARISPDKAFEIGSISKTMTAALLADLIEQGKASLDDPLDDYLPAGQKAPQFDGQRILLRHVVTHTSGLPVVPDFSTAKSMDNPYAQVNEASVLKTLSGAKLSRPPGSQYEYSNYAMMLLSSVIARRAGSGFEALMRKRLFAPTGMDGAYINQKPATVSLVQGHTPNGKPASAWTFQTNVSGVGGVKATLDDMVRYMQAQLGLSASSASPALRFSQLPVKTESSVPMAMNWMLAPLDERRVFVHEGGTGGFSAFAAFDLKTQRAVVVLSDTALTSTGGLGTLGNHLLDARLPLGKPRLAATPDPALLETLAGDYLISGMPIRLRADNGRLYAQAAGQAEYELGFDSEGDFYPLGYDAILRPNLRDASKPPLTFLQSGAALPMLRADQAKAAEPAPTVMLTPAQLADYPGVYAIMPPTFLKVFIENGRLMAQASGQGAFVLDAAGEDVFTAKAYGIEIRFERDAAGKVVMLGLLQAGMELKGARMAEKPGGG